MAALWLVLEWYGATSQVPWLFLLAAWILALLIFAGVYSWWNRAGLRLRPDSPMLLTTLGEVLYGQGKDDEAANTLGKVLARNPLGPGEDTNSSLAVSDGDVFIRTFNHLWCVGEKKEKE